MKKELELTIKEKIELLTGETVWTTKGISEKGIPSIRMADGPNGVRREKQRSTCFPSAALLACSFNEDILFEVGRAIGYECREHGVDILLGPSVNIKRSPLCGRNFEYYSEDSYLAGVLASAYVKGVQSQGVGACVKHFAANNQESFRMTVNSVIGERALHEVYLKVFEMIVKTAKPYALMTSYNRLNGKYVSENYDLITNLLREKWKFEGVTISDWGAVNDRIEALKAGLDLEMPCSPFGSERIEKGLKDGLVNEKDLDISVKKIISVALKCIDKPEIFSVNVKEIATKAVSESVVLLKNEDNILPIKAENVKIAVVGKCALHPAILGGGCAKNEILWTSDFITELKNVSINCDIRHFYDCKNEDFIKDANFVICFVGDGSDYNTEGCDRKNTDFPSVEIEVLHEVRTLNPSVIVIMQNGSAMYVTPLKNAKAIIESYYAGSGWGKALAEIVTGKVNPSGKLAETFPVKISDTPSYINFPGDGDNSVYAEGLFVGYRYFIAKEMPVSYPFGFGLSYTKFEISDIVLSSDKLSENEEIRIDYTIRNVGEYDGSEVVQIYAGLNKKGSGEPLYELKRFKKTFVLKGTGVRVSQTLSSADFKYYDSEKEDFVLRSGKYVVNLATSCVDVVKSFSVLINGVTKKVNKDVRIGELLTFPWGEKLVNEYLLGYLNMAIYGNFKTDKPIVNGSVDDNFFDSIMKDMPLRSLCNFSKGSFTEEMLTEFLDRFNLEEGKN